MKLRAILYFVFLMSQRVEGNSIYKEVATFCRFNGFNFITATSYWALNPKVFLTVSKTFSESKLRIRVLPFEEIDDSMKFHLDDFLVLSKGLQSPEIFQMELKAIQMRKIQKSFLLISNEVDENLLLNELQVIEGNAFFYLAYRFQNGVKLKQVVSLSNNSKSSVTDIAFNQFGHIIENYNMNVRISIGSCSSVTLKSKLLFFFFLRVLIF